MNGVPLHASSGLLFSGGLDSAILLNHLLSQGHRVQPFYIDSGLVWQKAERCAVDRILDHLARPLLEERVVFELPLADLYGDHWSVTGNNPPEENMPDEAVYLPGRNPLLAIKPALWCQLHGIEQLALGPLKSNPFADATDEFFAAYATMLRLATGKPLRLVRPFAQMNKQQVMQLGRTLPLGLTFSCIAPVEGMHCGACNKCGERKEAFRLIRKTDSTGYACDLAPR
jgi:7-cyano-7-deazaguanine synthase